jgi:hypothetical protein
VSFINYYLANKIFNIGFKNKNRHFLGICNKYLQPRSLFILLLTYIISYLFFFTIKCSFIILLPQSNQMRSDKILAILSACLHRLFYVQLILSIENWNCIEENEMIIFKSAFMFSERIKRHLFFFCIDRIY